MEKVTVFRVNIQDGGIFLDEGIISGQRSLLD